jgi:hypothetical protein
MLENYSNIKIRVLCGGTDVQKKGRTDEKTDIKRFIVTFRNFANASKIMIHKC